jgi:gamma-glutamyl-gamma-aminobutyraldehyde dehydrogenase
LRAAQLSFRGQAFIDGKFVDARSGRTFESINPANGEVLAAVAECNAADIDLAVAAGRRAFEDGRWSRMAPGDRKAVLLKLPSWKS